MRHLFGNINKDRTGKPKKPPKHLQASSIKVFGASLFFAITVKINCLLRSIVFVFVSFFQRKKS